MAMIKAEYYRFNGTDWDLFYFKTTADLIVETASYKVLTAAERTKISDYLTTFNAANKLAQIESGGKLPVGIIPALGYLPLTGGTITGGITVGGYSEFNANVVFNSGAFFNGNISSDNDLIVFNVEEVNFNGGALKNIAAPTAGTDAANKEYVDNLVSAGFKVKDPVKVATTQNIDLSATISSIDGATINTGDRVLVRAQSTASQNGVYSKNESGKLQRIAADSSLGSAVFVETGDTYNDYIFVHSSQDSWKIFTKPDTIKPGAGLTKTGTTISIANGGITNDMISNYAINPIKLQAFESDDGLTSWGMIGDASVETELESHLNNIFSAIKNLRGTAKYNTNNNQTIAGAYNLANSKIKSEIGTTVPGTSGYTTGDLFFKTL